MGFHIITKVTDTEIKHAYVSSYEELANLSTIQEDSIIYQGEEHWTPILVGRSPIYADFAKDWYRAGVKAEQVFKEQAKAEGLILENLSQDQASFKSYIVGKKYIPVTRGDFLIRNLGNVEIEVKCRTFYREHNERYFHFSVEDFQKHLNMIMFTRTPVFVAVYEREFKTDKVKANQLFMFDIEDLVGRLDDLEIKPRPDVDGGKCYVIPVRLTKKGFKLIDNYRKKLYG